MAKTMILDADIDAIISDAMGPSEEDATKAREDQLARLDAFSHTVKTLRKAAIDGRQQAGIETQWQEDDDHYESIDDSNRTTASRTKPYDLNGSGAGVTRVPSKTGNRSTVFVPLTRPYVDLAAARISDMYMPTDDRNWDGEPTPIPELIKAMEDLTPVNGPDGQPVVQDAAPVMGQGDQPMVDASGQPMTQAKPLTVADQAQKIMDQANEAWEGARKQIDDWHKECGYNGELRKMIHDLARIGVGIMKGPFPKSKTAKAVTKGPQGIALEIKTKIIPASTRVDPWRFFPDPACGEDINAGAYVFEQDFITRSKLRDLKHPELGYISEQIDICLEEGPISATTGTKKTHSKERNEADLFEIWYFEGQVEWQDLKDAGCECDGEEGDVFHATVMMVNDRVVKAALSHLDSGEFIYDVAVWQRKSGLWIGDGVARQGRTAQQGLNACARNLMDNAGQSSKPHKVINNTVITPGADPWTWHMDGDADLKDVAHAMMFFNVPSMQVELMNMIQYYQKMFEDSTGLPMLLQGQQGSAPETVGGMEMLQNNAGIVPRNIVRTLDDRITEPHTNRYYEYLLVHGDDDKIKGDFNIHARGSSALMERASQDQFLLQIMDAVLNPAFEMDPVLYIAELLKSKRINPERLKLSDEKKRELASRPPPEDPRIAAAKIMAASAEKRVETQAHVAQNQAAHDAQAETARQQFEASEAEKDRQLEQMGMEIDQQLASATLTSEERRDLEKQKVLLASVTLRLKVQERMADNSRAHQANVAREGHAVDLQKHSTPQAIAPEVEPAGQAPVGEAFTA